MDVSFAYTPDAKHEDCGVLGKGPMIGFAPALTREISEQLEEVYGKSVQDIIYYLAQYGALPAVKYEGETVSGIGALTDSDLTYNFNQAYGGNNSITFNTETGKLVFSGRQAAGGIVSYDNTGRMYSNIYDSASGYTFGTLAHNSKQPMTV